MCPILGRFQSNTNIKQLLDDIMNYQNRGLCYVPKPKAEADNTDTRSLYDKLTQGYFITM